MGLCSSSHTQSVFGLTDALKVKFPCIHSQLSWMGSLDANPWSTGDSLHSSTPCCTDSFLAVWEAAVQEEGWQVTEPHDSLFTLHQLLPRCSHNFIPQIAVVFEQCQ